MGAFYAQNAGKFSTVNEINNPISSLNIKT